jgi:hypothetical protein
MYQVLAIVQPNPNQLCLIIGFMRADNNEKMECQGLEKRSVHVFVTPSCQYYTIMQFSSYDYHVSVTFEKNNSSFPWPPNITAFLRGILSHVCACIGNEG